MRGGGGKSVAAELLDQMAAFAVMTADPTVHVPDAERHNPIFTLSGTHAAHPDECVSLAQWQERFVQPLAKSLRQSVFDKQLGDWVDVPLVAWDADKVVFSRDPDTNRAAMTTVREVCRRVMFMGLSDRPNAFEFLSSAFHFDAEGMRVNRAAAPDDPIPDSVALFVCQMESPPNAQPMPDSQEEEQHWVREPMAHVHLDPGNDYDAREYIIFTLSPENGFCTPSGPFVPALNLFLLSFFEAVLARRTLPSSPASSSSSSSGGSGSGNSRPKKVLTRRDYEEDGVGDPSKILDMS